MEVAQGPVSVGRADGVGVHPATAIRSGCRSILDYFELALKLVDSILARGLGLLARMEAWSQYMPNPFWSNYACLFAPCCQCSF